MTLALGFFVGWVVGFVTCALLSARERHEAEQATPRWQRRV